MDSSCFSGEENALPDVRQLPVPPAGEHERKGSEEEGGAVQRVHRRVQHPRARADQVEGEALRGVGQDVDQARGQVRKKSFKRYSFISIRISDRN